MYRRAIGGVLLYLKQLVSQYWVPKRKALYRCIPSQLIYPLANFCSSLSPQLRGIYVVCGVLPCPSTEKDTEGVDGTKRLHRIYRRPANATQQCECVKSIRKDSPSRVVRSDVVRVDGGSIL